MNIVLLKSKIHHAIVTGVDMGYEGSIVIDADLLDEVNLRPYEKVLVANLTTGSRFETYCIEGERGAGRVELNGAAARLGQVGDRITIFAFATVSETEAKNSSPRIIKLDEENRVVLRSYSE